MDFFDLARLLLRWWFVTLPLIVLTIMATAVLSGRIEPEFTARGSMMLVGPSGPQSASSDIDNEVVNPLLSLNGALPTAAYVTSLSITTPQVQSILADQNLSTSFDVAAQDRLPIILIETRAESREIATNTALRIVDLIDEDLRLRQDAADVPTADRVTADVISIAVVGGADYGGRTRMRIAVLGLGIVATIGAAFALEGIRRYRHRTAQSEPADDSEPDDTVDREAERVDVSDHEAVSDPSRRGRGPDHADTDSPGQGREAVSQSSG